MNKSRLLAITKKEFIHIFRDKPSLVISFLMPLVMIFLFGYAVRMDVKHVSTVVFDNDRTKESRLLVAGFRETGYFTIKKYVLSKEEITKEIAKGSAKVGVVIPRDYQTRLLSGEKSQVQVLIDGSDPTVARTTLSFSQLLAKEKSVGMQLEALEKRGKTLEIGGIDLRPRVWYNPDMSSIKFNVPGLIGLIMQNITIMLTAFALVREKERGTMEQLIVTPIKPLELILGKLIPYVMIAFVNVTMVLLVGTLWFKVKVAGSVLLLLAATLVFLLGALGLGMFISTVSKTQLQAMQMTMLIILPSVLLSGFAFPREAMPVPVQFLGYFLPLTYFLQILRGIMLKGVGFQYLWQEVLLLGVFGVAIIVLSAVRFQKKLD